MMPRFFRARYFIWLVVPIALGVAVGLYGVPHGLYGNVTVGGGAYTTGCKYLGPYGTYRTAPMSGRCRWVLFVPWGGRA